MDGKVLVALIHESVIKRKCRMAFFIRPTVLCKGYIIQAVLCLRRRSNQILLSVLFFIRLNPTGVTPK